MEMDCTLSLINQIIILLVGHSGSVTRSINLSEAYFNSELDFTLRLFVLDIICPVLAIITSK